MATGVEQADGDAAATINAAGAFGIDPDALRATIDAELTEQLWRKPARVTGRLEVRPHGLAAGPFPLNCWHGH